MGIAWPPPDRPPGAVLLEPDAPRGTTWSDALAGAGLLAANRPCVRALRLLGGAAEVVDAWLACLTRLSPGPVVHVPSHVDEAALTGGIEIEATLAAGRPVRSPGLIERARGGVLVIRGSERVSHSVAAMLAHAMDEGAVRLVLLDGWAGEDVPPTSLLDRAAITLDLRATRWADVAAATDARHVSVETVDAPASLDDASLAALDRVAVALGGSPVRRLAHLSALASALASGGEVEPGHLLAAVRLNSGAALPDASDEPVAEADDGPPPSEADDTDDAAPQPSGSDRSGQRSEGARWDERERCDDGQDHSPSPAPSAPPPDTVADAILAALPQGLLDGAGGASTSGSGGEGRRARGGVEASRGAPVGLARRAPHPGARPAILPTLVAAVPWQRARGRVPGEPIRIRPSDLRWRRRRRPAGTTVVFAVDASGSAAAERLAEAKGAVEALLAEAYVRRDRVALVAFRQGRASLLLPPTRGLVTAKRGLRDLPGGGATPLAAGLVATREVCRSARAAGERALMVLLTDGRGNVALDGTTGRLASREDERRAARAIRAAGIEALVIDTAARPGRHAPALADEMGATLLAMPRSGGGDWATVVGRRLAG